MTARRDGHSTTEGATTIVKPLIYLASPFSQGDPLTNIRCSIVAQMRLIRHGECVPVSPLALTSLCHIVSPMSYEEWMSYDFSLIENCDALVRIAAEHGDDYYQHHSPGAEREVEFALSKGIPVFFSLDEVEAWLEA